MKKKRMKIIKLLVLPIVLILFGCEKEHLENQNHDSQKFRVKEVKLKNLMNESKFRNLLQSITGNSELQRSSFENQNGFTISNENVKIIETDSLISYTMLILPDQSLDTGSFENLVIQEDIFNNLKVAIYKYTPSSITSSIHNSFHFEGTIDKFSVINLSGLNKTSQPITQAGGCYDYILMCNNNSTGGIGAEHPAGANCRRTYMKLVTVLCSSPPFDVGFSSGSGGSGVGGGVDSPTFNNDEITTSPVLSVEDAQTFSLFLDNLRTTNLAVHNYLNLHPEIKNQSFSYLVQNNFTEESKRFISKFIEQCDLNPSLHLDLNASSKSPMNIDFSSIDNKTPEGAKFNAVYDALKTSPEFKSLFIDLFQNNNRINVEFKIGSVNNGANGNTSVIIGGFPICNTITISPAFLNSANKMEIAKTILHECIHAFLNIKLYDTGQGAAVSTLNSEQLFNLINQQYNGFSGSQDQHNFIYTYMLPTMVQILSDVKDTLVTPANNLEMNDVVVHIPYNNSPETRFVWADYFHNLSLNGLQNCSFFQNEIGIVEVINGLITPVNTINQTLMQSFIQYSIVSVNIHP